RPRSGDAGPLAVFSSFLTPCGGGSGRAGRAAIPGAVAGLAFARPTGGRRLRSSDRCPLPGAFAVLEAGSRGPRAGLLRDDSSLAAAVGGAPAPAADRADPPRAGVISCRVCTVL